MEKTALNKDQAQKTPPDTGDFVAGETDNAVPKGQHWLKYTGIGERHQKRAGSGPILGENITSLGSLEAEVLGLLWEIGRPATSMEVAETSLYKRRAHGQEPASFATITTTLRRLASKGLLNSQKNEARTPLYWPTVEREQMAARILNNVSQTLLGRSLHGLLPKLIGRVPSESEGAEEQREVQRLIDALELVAKTDGTKRYEQGEE